MPKTPVSYLAGRKPLHPSSDVLISFAVCHTHPVSSLTCFCVLSTLSYSLLVLFLMLSIHPGISNLAPRPSYLQTQQPFVTAPTASWSTFSTCTVEHSSCMRLSACPPANLSLRPANTVAA